MELCRDSYLAPSNYTCTLLRADCSVQHLICMYMSAACFPWSLRAGVCGYQRYAIVMPYQTIPVQQLEEEDKNKPKAPLSFDPPCRELAVEKYHEPKARWNKKAVPSLEGKGGQVCKKQNWESKAVDSPGCYRLSRKTEVLDCSQSPKQVWCDFSFIYLLP